jgi:tetratricopeptide (TPR) repeat protein
MFCFFILFQFQISDIKLFKGTFEEAKKKAKDENKNILLIFREEQDKNFENILNDAQIASFTENFINFLIKTRDSEGIVITKIFNVENLPVIILCNSECNEIDRFDNPKNSKELLKNLKNMVDDVNTLNYYLREVSKEPENPKIHYEIAKNYLERGEKEIATTYFINTVKYDEKHKINIGEYPYYLLTVRDLREKKWESSREFLKLYPKSKYSNFVYLALADYFLKYNDYERARNTYEEYLSKFPDDHIALNNFAYLSAMLNINLDKALECVDKAIQLINENITKAIYMDTKAEIYFKMKKYSDAVEVAKIALEIIGNARERSEIEEHLRKYQNYIK